MQKCETPPETLLEFPCSYSFKALGPATQSFVTAVRAAAERSLQVPDAAIRIRPSSGGKYQCVSLTVGLENFEQLKQIYADIRLIPELRFML